MTEKDSDSTPVCIIHTTNDALLARPRTSRQLIKALERDGWILRGTKGSHHVYSHPAKPGHLSVPHPKKELGIGLVNKLLKQAGLK